MQTDTEQEDGLACPSKAIDLEQKTNQLLDRLRLLQIKQCCQHIDQQIGAWYRKHEQNPIKQEDSHTVGCFLSNIKHLESFDSDATESTSSNDSYDELEGFSHDEIPPRKVSVKRANGYPTTSTSENSREPTDIKKKAVWRWANERCRLASRWTWLQAQIADLEFRIRQQNDFTIQIRAHKSSVVRPSNVENSCSRTVPLQNHFKRRRLIRSSQILSNSTKKLVKFSVIPCICSSLPQTISSCLSCNGRYNYLTQSGSEKGLPFYERVSLLDPCCHPTLSFPDDLTLTSQLAYLLKQETINIKKNRPGRKKGSTNATSSKINPETSTPKHQLNKKRFQSQTMIASNKLRRKYYKSNASNPSKNTAWINSLKRSRRASCSDPNHVNTNTNSNASAQSVTKRRRSEQSAYDIDNIVIPFSIAATTRVEILEYKEIVTPSWRIAENGSHNNVSENNSVADKEAVDVKLEKRDDEEEEDISDEAFKERHSKGETEEKKRFSLRPNATNNMLSKINVTN